LQRKSLILIRRKNRARALFGWGVFGRGKKGLEHGVDS
jgi:hypothetical protein